MATENSDAPSGDNALVQRLLQAGLAMSVLLMFAGLMLQLASGQRMSRGVKLDEVFGPSLPLGERLMALGVVVLAFTPVARVLSLLVLWLRERDLRFAAVAAMVLATLGLAIALGGG